MGMSEEMKKLTREIVSSYEVRISTVATIVNRTQQMLEEFRTERNKVNQQLREMLAREKYLRKKDFDHMMEDILFRQDARENQIKTFLTTFLKEQQNMAETIQSNLISRKELDTDYLGKMIEENKEKQKINISQINVELKNFQEEYKEILMSFHFLLEKGETIRIKEIKKLIENIRSKQLGVQNV
jgi:hypothetical protein